jgi:RNA 2',3'-cyclic 3'-phosphodiesterase
VRLFIAIPLPSSVALQASRVLPDGVSGLRRVPPENLHVTLAFLGFTPDERLSDAAAAAKAAAAQVTPFRLAFEGAGRFPERGRPRVVWLAITEGRESVLRLGAAVAVGLRERKLSFDDGPLSPHLTLARVPDALALTDARALAATVDQLRPPRLDTDVAEIVVMESVLSRSGPTYAARSHAPLGQSTTE